MGTLLRLLLIVVLVVGVGFLVLGYWAGSSWNRDGAGAEGTTGTLESPIDTSKARERGAEVGEQVAVAGERIRETVSEASLTAKIKAKMALDDAIEARAIDVTTSGTTVTLSGTVETAAERERAVRLARETEGVSDVVDRLGVVER